MKLAQFGLVICLPLSICYLVYKLPKNHELYLKRFDQNEFTQNELDFRKLKVDSITSKIIDAYLLPVLNEMKEDTAKTNEAVKIISSLEIIKTKLAELQTIRPKNSNNIIIDEIMLLLPQEKEWYDEIEDFNLLKSEIATLRIEWEPDLAKVEKGRNTYKALCRTCHGANGNAIQITPEALAVVPRDFTGKSHTKQNVVFKFSTSDKGDIPALNEDIKDTIKNGLPGTPMPGFPRLADDEIEQLLEYIKTFGYLKWKFSNTNSASISVPKVPVDIFTSLERINGGRELFKNICLSCHGDIEAGGSALEAKPLDWNNPVTEAKMDILPRNFAFEPLRKGHPSQLFRTIRLGIKGTSMPATSLSDDETWSLASYIYHLRKQAAEGKIVKQEHH